MVQIELMCGGCDSTFQITISDDAYEDTAWLMAQRFMNAHALSCNYATPMAGVSTDEDDEDPGD
jgi:stress-induced morphogen